MGMITSREDFKAEVISDGRITIPKTVRELLEVSDGDIVKVSMEKVSRSPGATPGPQEGGPLQSEAQVNPQGG